MARTLPWLAKSPANAAQPPPSKRQKLAHPSSDPEPNTTSTTNPKATSKRKRNPFQEANRTPSTSPPPQPPSQHTMRPGLDADDGYIMVEDEFLATAQLYTKHLHHAEYQRLKNLARTRDAQTSPSDINRPVSTTVMREELRRKKTAEARSKRIDTGLDPILLEAVHKSKGDESSSSDSEIEKDDDPWQGTQLHRFMTVSPRKERGLMGLQGVVSLTRAAAGFAAPERNSVGSPSVRRTAGKAPVAAANTSETDDDDDDLDAPTTRASTIPPPFKIKPERRSPSPSIPPSLGTSILRRPPTTECTSTYPHEKKKKPNPSPSNPQKRPFLDVSSLTTTHKIKPEPHSSPPPPSTNPSPPSSPPSPAYVKPELPSKTQPTKSTLLQQRLKAHREKAEREKRGGARGAMLEIPVFLV